MSWFVLQDYKGQIQSVLQIIRSPRKPRSPLSDSSIMLIQEGNESDVANVDVPKARRGKYAVDSNIVLCFVLDYV